MQPYESPKRFYNGLCFRFVGSLHPNMSYRTTQIQSNILLSSLVLYVNTGISFVFFVSVVHESKDLLESSHSLNEQTGHHFHLLVVWQHLTPMWTSGENGESSCFPYTQEHLHVLHFR